jgi:hypothetical protein
VTFEAAVRFLIAAFPYSRGVIWLRTMSMAAPEPWVPIQLIWRQRLAAYWSIFWPCWALSFVLVMFLASPILSVDLKQSTLPLEVAAQVSFFLAQALTVHRIVHKRYRTFQVRVVRDDPHAAASSLSVGEGLPSGFSSHGRSLRFCWRFSCCSPG